MGYESLAQRSRARRRPRLRQGCAAKYPLQGGHEGSTLVPRGTSSTGLAWATVGAAGGAVQDTIGSIPTGANRPERVEGGLAGVRIRSTHAIETGIAFMAASGSIEGVTLTRIGRPADTACQLGSAVLVDVRVADPAGRRGRTKPDSPARQLMHRKRRSPVGFFGSVLSGRNPLEPFALPPDVLLQRRRPHH